MHAGKRPYPQLASHKRRRTGAEQSEWCNILESDDTEQRSSTQDSSWDGLAPSDPANLRPLHSSRPGGDERIKIVHSALPDRTLVLSHPAGGGAADTRIEEAGPTAHPVETPPPKPLSTPSSRILEFFKKKPSTPSAQPAASSASSSAPSTPLAAAKRDKRASRERLTRSRKADGNVAKARKKTAPANPFLSGKKKDSGKRQGGSSGGRMTRRTLAGAHPPVGRGKAISAPLGDVDSGCDDDDAFKELSPRAFPIPAAIDIPSDESEEDTPPGKKRPVDKAKDSEELCSQGSVVDLRETAQPAGKSGNLRTRKAVLDLPKRAPSTPKDNMCRVGLEIVGKDRFAAAELKQKRGSSKRSKEKAEKLRKDRQQLKAIFSAVPNCSYEAEQKRWSFPLWSYKQVLKCLKSFGVTIEAVPKTVLDVMLEQNQAAASLAATAAAAGGEQIDLSRIPPDMLHALYPFQLRGVVYALKKNGRCIIGDGTLPTLCKEPRANIHAEMGLGKTLQAIAIAACYRDEWPILVICPSSLRMAWSEELTKWLKLCPLDINVIMNGKGNVSAPVNIISYELVPRLASEIAEASFRVIIADESHYLKNLKAKRTKAIEPLLESAQRVLLLSGTPALSRPAELYPQIKAVKPDLFPKFEPFGVRYCAGHKVRTSPYHHPRSRPWSDTLDRASLAGITLEPLIWRSCTAF